MQEQMEQEEAGNIEKNEGLVERNGLEIFEASYDNINEAGGGWSMTLSFLKKDSLLFLFMRLTDQAYIDYGENVVDYMIGTIDFND